MQHSTTETHVNEYFPSKRDTWLGVIIWLPLGGVLPLMLLTTPKEMLVLLLIIVPTYAFVGWIWFQTGYTIMNDMLFIRCGPFRWRIPWQDIKRIRSSRSPLSSAALSFDRLEIRYQKFNVVHISPDDQERFINIVQERAPQADIQLNKS